MTINELKFSMERWFTEGWAILSNGSFGDLTIGQAIFTVVNVYLAYGVVAAVFGLIGEGLENG